MANDELFGALRLTWDRDLFPMPVAAGEPLRPVKRFLRTMPM